LAGKSAKKEMTEWIWLYLLEWSGII